MDHSNFIKYQHYEDAPLTIGWLETHQSQGYDLTRPLDRFNPLFAVCSHKKMSNLIFDWLIDSGYGPELTKVVRYNSTDQDNLCIIASLLANRSLDIELFESVINFIATYHLWSFISTGAEHLNFLKW